MTISVIKTAINVAASQCTGAQNKTVKNSNNNNIHNYYRHKEASF